MNGADKICQNKTGKGTASRVTLILSFLLAAQIGLSVLLRATAVRYEPVETSAQIIPFDLNKVNKMVMENHPQGSGSKKSTLILQQLGIGWSLPESYGYPVAQRSVNSLIEDLSSLKKGLPVSTTSGAIDRFKVSPDNFEHSITLFANNKNMGTMFVGSSPSYRNVYVRWSESQDVYCAEFPTDALSTEATNWFDTTRVQFAKKGTVAVDFADFTVQLNDRKWVLTTHGQDYPIRPQTADFILNRLICLVFDSVLGVKDLPEYNSARPSLVYKVSLRGAREPITFSFSKPQNKANYVLKRSDMPFYLSVNKWFVDNAKTITPESVLRQDADDQKREEDRNKIRHGRPAGG